MIYIWKETSETILLFSSCLWHMDLLSRGVDYKITCICNGQIFKLLVISEYRVHLCWSDYISGKRLKGLRRDITFSIKLSTRRLNMKGVLLGERGTSQVLMEPCSMASLVIILGMFCLQDQRQGRKWITLWTHKIHPIAHPHGWAMWWILWIFGENRLLLIGWNYNKILSLSVSRQWCSGKFWLDCSTILNWWLYDCQCVMRCGLHLSGVISCVTG